MRGRIGLENKCLPEVSAHYVKGRFRYQEPGQRSYIIGYCLLIPQLPHLIGIVGIAFISNLLSALLTFKHGIWLSRFAFFSATEIHVCRRKVGIYLDVQSILEHP